MFIAEKLESCLGGLIGWKNHYDTTEIPELPESLRASETKEYFQDKHPALRLDKIKLCLPENRTLESFLTEKTKVGITTVVNQIISDRLYKNYARKTLASETLLHGYGWAKDTIINESRFVGLRITPTSTTGLQIALKKIGFQFSQAQNNLKIYLYHSSKLEALKEFNFTSTKPMDWHWVDETINFIAENEEHAGGSYIIGYYQDDVVGQAINFTDFNWRKGPCGGCDGGVRKSHWDKFNKYAAVTPVYVPAPSLNGRDNFDFRDTIESYDKSFGMNLRITAECDLTNFFCEHKHSLKTAIALSVTHTILKEMQFSSQINAFEEDLKSLIIRDLEGDKDTNYINIVDQLKQEIQAINFDHSNLAQPCLPGMNTRAPKYGVA